MRIVFLHMTMGLIDRGSEVTTDMFANALTSDHEVMVIQSGPIEKKSKYTSVRVYPLKKAPPIEPHHILDKILFRLHWNYSSRAALAFTHAAVPVIAGFSPDVIFATNGSDQVSLLRQSFPGVKIVVIGHSGIGHDDLANLHARPNLFIAVTPQAQEWARLHANLPTKVVCIPNPINLKIYRQAKKLEYGLPAPVILVVGALTAYKNIDQVVSAARSLAVSLLLVGDGEQANKIADLLNKYPTDFRWLKNISPDDMPSIYKSADIFCFVPDQEEAFGRVYIEAMAAGLPIVASNDTIRRDLIGKNGIYVDPHNQEKISQGIIQALSVSKIDYSKELSRYEQKSVIIKLEKELHELIKD